MANRTSPSQSGKACLHCGIDITGTFKLRKFCSDKCQQTAACRKATVKCQSCGEELVGVNVRRKFCHDPECRKRKAVL